MSTEIFLGFDLRQPLAGQIDSWTKVRRAEYLIRPEIATPISVDRCVWPAVSVNTDDQYPLFLWGSMTELREHSLHPLEGGVMIDIAALPSTEDSLNYWQRIMFGRADTDKDSSPQYEVEIFGYDVADRYLVSGLSNCRFSDSEMGHIRHDWSWAINVWGLFDRPDLATSFAALCNSLIPEHEPFEAYRLRRIIING